MINVLVAHTFELDDADDAAAEILQQLATQKSLRKNSVGIITCHAEFLYSGIVEALSKRLPFELIGMTTLGSSINGTMGVDILTLSVLTSDEASFSSTMTTSLAEDQAGPVAAAYEEAAARLSEKPSLVIAFGPLLESVGGETYVAELDRLAEGAPIFGSLACDHTISYHESFVIRGGVHQRDALAMVLVAGPVDPKFFFISISGDNIPKQKGIITSSTNNVIHTINDISAVEYFMSIGLTPSHFEISGSIPLMVDYMDGAPSVGRAIYMAQANGDVICCGGVPTGGTIAPAFLDSEEVTRSARRILDELAAADAGNGMLVITCQSRSLDMGGAPLREIEIIEETIGNGQSYHVAYSGGEICPIYAEGGRRVNRFHNFSFTACMF